MRHVLFTSLVLLCFLGGTCLAQNEQDKQVFQNLKAELKPLGDEDFEEKFSQIIPHPISEIIEKSDGEVSCRLFVYNREKKLFTLISQRTRTVVDDSKNKNFPDKATSIRVAIIQAVSPEFFPKERSKELQGAKQYFGSFSLGFSKANKASLLNLKLEIAIPACIKMLSGEKYLEDVWNKHKIQ